METRQLLKRLSEAVPDLGGQELTNAEVDAMFPGARKALELLLQNGYVTRPNFAGQLFREFMQVVTMSASDFELLDQLMEGPVEWFLTDQGVLELLIMQDTSAVWDAARQRWVRPG